MRHWVIRVLALILCLISLQKAWAGVWLYKGETAFKQKDFKLAFVRFERAQNGNLDRSRLLYLLGQSAWHLGLEKNEISWFEKSRDYFQRVTQTLPFYGRAWLFLGLNQTALERRSANGVTVKEWYGIKPWFEKAYQEEPGSAWMAFMTGIQFLSHDRFLSQEERTAAFERIRKSTRIRRVGPSAAYLDKPSFYLEPALTFLHKHKFNFEFLKSITPVDFPSYRTLLDFLARNGLWEYRPALYTVYLNLEKEAYDGECTKGEKHLSEGNPAKSFLAFRKAFWMRNWSYLRAKAGILAAQGGMENLPDGVHPLFKEDYRETLKAVLQEEDEDLGKTISFLSTVVQKTHDPELIKLYSFRMSGGKRGDSSEDLTTSFLPPAAWWGKAGENNRMETKGRRTMGVNLKPGRWTIIIQARSEPNATTDIYGYIRFLLNGRSLGEAYLKHENFRPLSFEVKTMGGKRWLQVDFLNGVEASVAKAGPIVELGNVEIANP